MSHRLGLDIGGANLKAADAHGHAESIPFELWKRPEDLASEIRMLLRMFPPCSEIALTMTAELCDCFETKRQGVNAVIDAVRTASDGKPMRIWGTDEQFHTVEEIRTAPWLAAASNWVALASLAAKLEPKLPGFLIDVGSTTTDLIPLHGGRVAAIGRSDPERFHTGELVYAGVRRTPLCALGTSVIHRGRPTGMAAELFATTLDVYLMLGIVPTDSTDRSTADGRPATREAARDRLSRMLGADRDEFSEEDSVDFARNLHQLLLTRLAETARRVCEATIGKPVWAIVAGSGEFLAKEVAQSVLHEGSRIIGLSELWGPTASVAACAFAVVRLADQEGAAPRA